MNDIENIQVTGFSWGDYKGCTALSSLFILTNPEETEEGIIKEIPIHRYNALPSYCPWIEYTLIVRIPNEDETLYSVIKIVKFNIKRIKKKDIISFLLHKRSLKNEEKDNLENYKKYYQKQFKNILGEIYDIEEIDSIPDNRLRSEVYALLEPCFRGSLFFSLLKYFPSSLLLRLNNKQLCAFYALFIQNPIFFCFWNIAMDLFSELTDKSTKKPLFDDDDGLFVDKSLIFPYRERLLEQEKKEIYYFRDYPGLSFNHIKHALKDPLVTYVMPENIEEKQFFAYVHESMRVYFNSQCFFYSYGKTCFNNVELGLRSKRAFEILKSTGALISCYKSEDVFTFPENEKIEFQLIKEISEKVKDLLIFDCPYYNQFYISKFIKWFKYEYKCDEKTLFLSANRTTADYMTKKTSISFIAIDDVTKKTINSCKDLGVIIIDKTHKCSPRHIIFLLQLIKTPIRLYFFGDSDEHKLHSRRGAGELFHSFVNAFQNRLINWDIWNKKDPTAKIYHGLKNDIQKNLEIIYIPNNSDKSFNNLFSNLKKFNKKTKSKKRKKDEIEEDNDDEDNDDDDKHIFKMLELEEENENQNNIREIPTNVKNKNTEEKLQEEQGFYIFCSREHPERDEYVKKLINHKIRIQSDNYRFSLGQYVHVMEYDVWGTIDRIFEYNYNLKNPLVEIKKRSPINIRESNYTFEISGHRYDTKNIILQSADIEVISKFGGVPRKNVIFICGPSTTLLDLLSATKYCTNIIYIMIPENVKFLNIQSNKKNEPRDLLEKKLKDVLLSILHI